MTIRLLQYRCCNWSGLRSPWFLLPATGAMLGASLPLGKLAVGHGVAPLSFMLVPAFVAGILLALIAWWRHGWPPGPWFLLRFGLGAGFLGSALPGTLSVWVAAQAGASVTAIAYTLPPAVTLGLALLTRLEQLRWQRMLAVGLGLCGALWLALARLADGVLSVAGVMALLAIPLAIGVGNLFRARYLPQKTPTEWLGAAMMLGSFLLLLPVWLATVDTGSGLADAGAPYIGWQILATVLGSLFYFRLQRQADPVTMSFIGYAMAATAVLNGTWLLGETLPWELGPAAALIALGFWLIHKNPALARSAD